MSRFVAVGDIHGCSQTLAKLLELLNLDEGDTLLSTGDLSSKGEDSQGVHEQLIRLQEHGVRVILLLGNHEAMLLAMQRRIGADVDLSGLPESLFRDAEISFLVRGNETWATLKSYGLERVDDPVLWSFRNRNPQVHFENVLAELQNVDWRLPQSHLDLLCQGKTHHIERNCLFVHSGLEAANLEFDSASEAVQTQIDQDARELCWTRSSLGKCPDFPELLLHGHTPLFYLHSFVADTTPWRDNDLVFKSVIHNGAINLDSGVFLEAGHLTAVEIPEDGCPSNFRFIRIPRLDPVCKDRLWHLNYM